MKSLFSHLFLRLLALVSSLLCVSISLTVFIRLDGSDLGSKGSLMDQRYTVDLLFYDRGEEKPWGYNRGRRQHATHWYQVQSVLIISLLHGLKFIFITEGEDSVFLGCWCGFLWIADIHNKITPWRTCWHLVSFALFDDYLCNYHDNSTFHHWPHFSHTSGRA